MSAIPEHPGEALAACPFCDCVMDVSTNRDWHTLHGNHDEGCIFLDQDMRWPANALGMDALVSAWNRCRAPTPLPAPGTVEAAPTGPEIEAALRWADGVMPLPGLKSHLQVLAAAYRTLSQRPALPSDMDEAERLGYAAYAAVLDTDSASGDDASVESFASAARDAVEAEARTLISRLEKEGGQVARQELLKEGERLLALVEAQAGTVERLRDALTGVVELVESAGLKNLVNGVQLGATSWYVKMSDAMESARAALKPATGTTKEGAKP